MFNTNRRREMRAAALLLVAVASFSAAEWMDFGSGPGRSAQVNVLDVTPSAMEIEITVPGVTLSEISGGGMDFTAIGVPGATPTAPEPGYPSVPKASFLAAVSEGGQPTWTIIDESLVDLGEITPYPFQPIPVDNTYENPPFTYVPEAYAPGAESYGNVLYEKGGVVRSVQLGRFGVPLVRWDASTGTAKAVRRMRLRIDLGGQATIDHRLYTRFWEPTMRQWVVNHEALGEPADCSSFRTAGPVYARTREEARALDGAHLLIMSGDDFADTMIEEFVTAKWEQGFAPSVVSAGSWSTSEIRDYIEDAYNTWTVPPSFVLFVGDSDDIEPYYTNSIYSDNRYLCMDSDPEDYMPDLFGGRFVTPTDFITNVIDKTLKWQFDPLMDSDFWNNGLCAGMIQTNGDNTADRWFCFTCESVRDTYQDIYGKTFTREYVKDTSQPEPYYYRDDLPSAGQQVPTEIDWDGNADGITNRINEGIFLLQHRDHGSTNGWADPPYYISDLNDLSNGDMTPMVMSINCSTGEFTSECFAEVFFRMEGGAVAVVAASNTSYSYFNDYFCYGLYRSFNDEYTSPPAIYTDPGGNYMGGQALVGGKMEMYVSAPFNPYGGWQSYAEDECDLFHWFGDPTMDMRTEVPEGLSVTAPASLGAGATSADFTVEKGGEPVWNAMVCLRKEDSDSVYAVGWTDSSGTVTVTFDPISDTNEMPWMVTAHNAIHYTGVINGAGTAGRAGAPVASVGAPAPNPFGSSVAIPVQLDAAAPVSLSIYDVTGRMVSVVQDGQMAPGSHQLVWDGRTGGIPAPQGIYMARLRIGDRTSVYKLVLNR
jgi:hypothetical protein